MPNRSPSTRPVRRATAWSLAWFSSAALYLLLIDTTSLPELYVGAGAAALAATGFELAREQDIAHLATRLAWLRRIYRPVASVPRDVALVCVAAVQQLAAPRRRRGAFRAVPFELAGEDELATGQRALAESLGSFAPNTIVVGVDRDREVILVHQLRRRGGREAIDVLELG